MTSENYTWTAPGAMSIALFCCAECFATYCSAALETWILVQYFQMIIGLVRT